MDGSKASRKVPITESRNEGQTGLNGFAGVGLIYVWQVTGCTPDAIWLGCLPKPHSAHARYLLHRVPTAAARISTARYSPYQVHLTVISSMGFCSSFLKALLLCDKQANFKEAWIAIDVMKWVICSEAALSASAFTPVHATRRWGHNCFFFGGGGGGDKCCPYYASIHLRWSHVQHETWKPFRQPFVCSRSLNFFEGETISIGTNFSKQNKLLPELGLQ